MPADWISAIYIHSFFNHITKIVRVVMLSVFLLFLFCFGVVCFVFQEIAHGI